MVGVERRRSVDFRFQISDFRIRGAAFGFAMIAVMAALAAQAKAQPFVNWETPHVHPIDLTPDGNTLLVCNTPDNRLEVFDVTSGVPEPVAVIQVGLDPVSVRARSNTEAWVANHISDSISIVDLATARVVKTIRPGDEPTDIIFAGSPQRAFVTVSQRNRVRVYDPEDLSSSIANILLEGEDPRALATDGTNVYAAIFESGNKTTLIDQFVTSQPDGPYNGQNPPPNDGTEFNPPIGDGLPTPPQVGLILKKGPDGAWMDDNAHDWSDKVGWDLHDHDVAIIDANTLAVSYATGLMNLNMQLTVRPDGAVTVVGTDAINDIRFEPNVRAKFIKAFMAEFDPADPADGSRADLNPHLDYSVPTIPQDERDESIADPRGIVWNAGGERGYVTGMGSNNVIVVDPAGARLATIDVGQGPTGIVLDAARDRLYVVNKFEGSLSVIDTTLDSELTRVYFFDPTPNSIRDGRPFLYNAHETSGLGQAACASCHVDSRMDNIAWDLGNPEGAVKDFNQTCNGVFFPFFQNECEDWHPMKGPMTTQTLVGIISTEPFHWRGDREDLPAFNIAFEGLLGDDEPLTDEEMDAFVTFLTNTRHPPNPNRNFDGSLKTSLVIDDGTTGNPVNGESMYLTSLFDGGLVSCVQCHTLPDGSKDDIISGNLLQESQSFKVPQLRNAYEKTGFSQTSMNNNRGFGFVHDGNVPTMVEFLQAAVFTFNNDQQRRDVAAFVFSFATDTHAAVGWQVTLDATNNQTGSPEVMTVNDMLALADAGKVGVVVKGRLGGEQRGWKYVGGNQFQSDREGETIGKSALRQSAAVVNEEKTYTVVPLGSQNRIGIDRDKDTHYDRDELDGCADPADPISQPKPRGDINLDNVVNSADVPLFVAVLLDPDASSGQPLCLSDMNGDGATDGADVDLFVGCLLGGNCP